MATTLITLATGRTLEVEGTYSDITAALTPRQLSETGQRELRKADGELARIALGAILLIEQGEEKRERKGAIGFSRALEEAAA
jgi:imidazoleglycerol phosphate synthase glutamine amidotransferase subunit HisH